MWSSNKFASSDRRRLETPRAPCQDYVMRDLLRRLWEPSVPAPADVPAAPPTPGLAQPSNEASERAAVEARLVGWVRELSRGRLSEIDPDAVLLDRGYLDSITAIEFLAKIEQVYGVRLPERRLSGPRGTVRVLADELSRAPRA